MKKVISVSLIGLVFFVLFSARGGDNASETSNVTRERLLHPPDGDWLQWGRTYDGLSFSPLKKINRENVNGLRLAWRKEISAGPGMPAPLVHNGVLFLQIPPDSLLALDGATGRVLWTYQYKPGNPGSKKMGIALSEDKVFMPTTDGHVVALNFRTGETIWDHRIKATGLIDLRSAPLIVRDKVIVGAPGAIPGGGFIVGLESSSGREVWRFKTLAQPNSPGGNTWNDLPLERRTGGFVWHQGTYDPELNLVFFGAAPTHQTFLLRRRINKPGVTTDALYTDCTIALDPDTGKLIWFYQHLPNDQWDLDWVFEKQIVNLKVMGKEQKAVVTTGKLGITEALDAKTGKYLFSIDFGIQDLVSSINKETGAKTIPREKFPSPTRKMRVCPGIAGARSWPPTSYNQQTGTLYVALFKSCTQYQGEGTTLVEHPKAQGGTLGRLQAIDVNSRKLSWAVELESPLSTSVLGTAGGLVFAGDVEPSLKAFDDSNGKILWTAKLDDFPSSYLITYGIGEKQYVAVVAGLRNNLVRDLTSARDWWRDLRRLPAAEKLPNKPAVWVFGL